MDHPNRTRRWAGVPVLMTLVAVVLGVGVVAAVFLSLGY